MISILNKSFFVGMHPIIVGVIGGRQCGKE
jgi:hypothetical protein